MNRLLAATLPLLIVLASSLSADVSTSLVEKQNSLGPNTATYDLVVHVNPGDDWTSSTIKAVLTGGTFFQHPQGSNGAPDPNLFAFHPTLMWDTFVTTPEYWPNSSTGPFSGPSGSFQPTQIDTAWFDLPPNGGGGDWVVARLSVENLTPGWSLAVKGDHTSVLGGPTLYSYELVVPEPGPAAFLLCLVAFNMWSRRQEAQR